MGKNHLRTFGKNTLLQQGIERSHGAQGEHGAACVFLFLQHRYQSHRGTKQGGRPQGGQDRFSHSSHIPPFPHLGSGPEIWAQIWAWAQNLGAIFGLGHKSGPDFGSRTQFRGRGSKHDFRLETWPRNWGTCPEDWGHAPKTGGRAQRSNFSWISPKKSSWQSSVFLGGLRVTLLRG